MLPTIRRLPPPVPHESLLDLWLSRYSRRGTAYTYRRNIISFFGHSPTVEDVQNVSWVRVNAHIQDMQEQGYATGTIQVRITALRVFFAWCVDIDVIARSPIRKALVRRLAKNFRKPPTFLTRQGAEKIIRGARCRRDRVMLRTMVTLVLRRGEVHRMDIEHLTKKGGKWILDIPEAKGGENQFVSVPEALALEIKAYAKEEGIKKGPIWRSKSPTHAGKRLSPIGIYMVVRRAGEDAGLPKVFPHALRHTGCTLAIEAGVDVVSVKNHARHKSINTTMGYVHQLDAMNNPAPKAIDITTEE